MLESTRYEFVNNKARNGGAMALLGFSVLKLHPGSQVLCFISFNGNGFSGRGQLHSNVIAFRYVSTLSTLLFLTVFVVIVNKTTTPDSPVHYCR